MDLMQSTTRVRLHVHNPLTAEMLSIPNVMVTVGDMAEETAQRVRRKSSKKGVRVPFSILRMS